MGCSSCSWLVWIPLILQCVGAASLGAARPPAAAGCEDVYRGMGDCLIRFGDQVNRLVAPGGIPQLGELSVCSYWDEYHACKAEALTDCPADAAQKLTWLHRELDRVNGPGSLFQLCHSPAANAGSAPGPAAATNRLVFAAAALVLVAVSSRERL